MALRNFKIVSLNNQPINYNSKITIKDYQSPVDAAKKVLKLISLNMSENEKIKLKSTFMIKEITSKKIYGPYKGTYIKVDKLKIKPCVKLCKKFLMKGGDNKTIPSSPLPPCPPPPSNLELLHQMKTCDVCKTYCLYINDLYSKKELFSSGNFQLDYNTTFYVYLIENVPVDSNYSCVQFFNINLDTNTYTIKIKEVSYSGSSTSFNKKIKKDSIIFFTHFKIE
jgi:hypothetical protein